MKKHICLKIFIKGRKKDASLLKIKVKYCCFHHLLPMKRGKKAMKKTKMLKKNHEFKNVLSRGKYYSGSCIEAFVKKNKNKNNYLGIAISVKIAKAVKRNYLKRLIRENYRIIENQVKSGYTVVFLWKKKVVIQKASFEQIYKDMYIILNKAGILEENQ